MSIFTAEEIVASLPQFTGTEGYTRMGLPPLLATDGVAWLCEVAGCYWLVDVIASHQLTRKVAQEPFQVWTLTKVGEGADIVATDGNGVVLARQTVPFTDFPLPKISLWVEGEGPNRVVLLPSEH